MSVPLFLSIYVTGAAALALWFDLRFPGIRPRGWLQLGIAVTVALVLDSVCVRATSFGPPVVGVIGVALPAIAATLLVCIWMLRMMRSAMPA